MTLVEVVTGWERRPDGSLQLFDDEAEWLALTIETTVHKRGWSLPEIAGKQRFETTCMSHLDPRQCSLN